MAESLPLHDELAPGRSIDATVCALVTLDFALDVVGPLSMSADGSETTVTAGFFDFFAESLGGFADSSVVALSAARLRFLSPTAPVGASATRFFLSFFTLAVDTGAADAAAAAALLVLAPPDDENISSISVPFAMIPVFATDRILELPFLYTKHVSAHNSSYVACV